MSDGAHPPSPYDDDPEAELRAASPRQPLGLWWVGVVGLGVAGVLLVTENLRAYGYALGATMGVLAVLRAVLPESRAGGLAVRGRWVDAGIMALLGAAVAVLAGTLRLVG
ncbi:DUF3017 domain-containing protein [Ornithinimicrobium pekingense]|uniref:DUF3017 domain-containing protein n=1 Tax=Ornithinimicrobium pekingense TaxID=384677 RepID=A0ABQ2F6X8_9MICO|nr:DUF3017 domain-containing protein [Ornithinimicrobium pekingense]GGK64947.1 hypothetical protein GCM10011509_11620 [Ornithinimicrobium pekingense]